MKRTQQTKSRASSPSARHRDKHPRASKRRHAQRAPSHLAHGESSRRTSRKNIESPKKARTVIATSAEGLLPRPRVRLQSAMRNAGLDEWKIGWALSWKINSLLNETAIGKEKLLLDYLKEASRHLDPAARAAAAESPAIEVIHNVPRPQDTSQSGSSEAPQSAGCAD